MVEDVDEEFEMLTLEELEINNKEWLKSDLIEESLAIGVWQSRFDECLKIIQTVQSEISLAEYINYYAAYLHPENASFNVTHTWCDGKFRLVDYRVGPCGAKTNNTSFRDLPIRLQDVLLEYHNKWVIKELRDVVKSSHVIILK